MGRKSKQEIYFESHKMTIYECLNSYSDSHKYFEEDKMFVALMLSGFSAAMAYRLSYKTSATMQSSAVLASRRVREPQIQTLLDRVIDCADSGLLYISRKGFKGKRRWEAWRRKQVKNIDTSPL